MLLGDHNPSASAFLSDASQFSPHRHLSGISLHGVNTLVPFNSLSHLPYLMHVGLCFANARRSTFCLLPTMSVLALLYLFDGCRFFQLCQSMYVSSLQPNACRFSSPPSRSVFAPSDAHRPTNTVSTGCSCIKKYQNFYKENTIASVSLSVIV